MLHNTVIRNNELLMKEVMKEQNKTFMNVSKISIKYYGRHLCSVSCLFLILYLCRSHANLIPTLAETLGEAIKENVRRLIIGTCRVSRITTMTARLFTFTNKQEAQLSQRDRATLCVIKYFAKSLKVTQDHSK